MLMDYSCVAVTFWADVVLSEDTGTLRLENNRIEGEIPSEVGNMSNLGMLAFQLLALPVATIHASFLPLLSACCSHFISQSEPLVGIDSS